MRGERADDRALDRDRSHDGAEYLRRTSVIGITWPVPAEIDDAELERRLFAPAGFNKPSADHAGLDPRPRRSTYTSTAAAA